MLGAARAGIDTVVHPRRIEKDLVDIPPETLENIRIERVESIEKALEINLEREGSV